MKPVKSFGDYGIAIPLGAHGEIDVVCPKCSPERRHKWRKDLSINVELGTWLCHHCGRSGGLGAGWKDDPRLISLAKPPRREFSKPAPLPSGAVKLPKAAIAWFTDRGISEAVLEANDVRAISRQGKPLEIQFPYYRCTELVNVKHRRLPKSFWMESGAERIFYGLDDIDGARWAVIVEGELDKLALHEAGIRNAVSVPDGAPSVGAEEYGSKFDFLEDEVSASILAALDHVVIAVDADEPGRKLAEELARRIGRHRCLIAQWPSGVKDANEALTELGPEKLKEIIEDARQWPIEGLITVRDVEDRVLDLYDRGLPPGESTGWRELDRGYTIAPGNVTVVTGSPGSGKSELVDNIMVNLGWPVAIYSPENRPIEKHVAKIAEKTTRKRFDKAAGAKRMRRDELQAVLPYLHESYFFVAPQSPTVEEVLDVAREIVIQYGARGVVLDPWNRFEHKRPAGLTETEYIGESLARIVNFASQHGVHVWIVVHPKKLERKGDGSYPVVRPWDISGSAHWFDMSDNILSVYRDKTNASKPVEVHVQKVRFSEAGELGVAELMYDKDAGRTYRGYAWTPGESGG